MAKEKNIEIEEGVLTTPMDTNTKEFKAFQLLLSNKAKALENAQKIQIELLAVQFKMEDYINTAGDDEEIITVGDFLRLYIQKLNLKQNKLATYIGLKPSNFSKILSGSRKINFELSFMLSHIFNLDPQVWIKIQTKNEFLRLKKEKQSYFQQYKLEDLLKVS